MPMAATCWRAHMDKIILSGNGLKSFNRTTRCNGASNKHSLTEHWMLGKVAKRSS